MDLNARVDVNCGRKDGRIIYRLTVRVCRGYTEFKETLAECTCISFGLNSIYSKNDINMLYTEYMG